MELDIPVINLAEIESRRAELARAAKEIGFFQLTGHGIAQSEIDRILAVTKEFFALPEQDRLAISNLGSPHFRGYTRLGTEHTNGRADSREQLDIAEELPARPPAEGEPAYHWLRGPNLWPPALPELRPIVLGWLEKLRPVADRLLDEFVVALGGPRGFFADAFAEDPHVHLKLIRYPGLGAAANEQGVGTHKDYGFLTLLLSDGVPGLRVQPRAGQEIAVEPRPGAFIVNLGELLEVASRGRLIATPHRVVATESERYSVAFFYNPSLDYRVRQLPAEFVADAPGFIADPDNPLFDVYGNNAMKGWLRAHPEVASRHHKELVERT
ncbi:isopenicillin N synthase family dioxygenase [Sciscionella sediminilitoris]|uniref:isopenicillin N synthase family dioxygenase n=1 Tax=Sciscionella sediminilitoris TaxID=1445613 RepID=UPI0004DF18C2|nr:2-oxoglutarate and iron-dependent oxygenase domain-containing protein [Sciscionella sp. SE31]